MNSHDGYVTPLFIGHVDNNTVVWMCLALCALPAIAEIILFFTRPPAAVRLRMKKHAHISTFLALCILSWLTQLEYIAQLNGNCYGHRTDFLFSSENLLRGCICLCIGSTVWLAIEAAWDLWKYKRLKSHK